jgi:hypothetical protein
MRNFLAMMHESGVTTAADMGTGIFGNPVAEIKAVKAAVASDPVGVRVLLTPIITDFMTRGKTPQEALDEVREWQALNTERVAVGNHFKLMIDGAIFSGCLKWVHRVISTVTAVFGWSMFRISRRLRSGFGRRVFSSTHTATEMRQRLGLLSS